MAKYELWINLYPGYGYNGPYPSKDRAELYKMKNRIECRKIEWESKEPTRVADYLVETPYKRTDIEHYPPTYWERYTYPIGSQPEGSILVPNSERTQE